MTASAVELYGRGLTMAAREPTAAGRWRLRYADGSSRILDLDRWCAPVTSADAGLLDRCTGPTLDVGCGPGRLVAALGARGLPALGVDIAPAAVRLAHAAGAMALRRSVFDRLPRTGHWSAVLLADGNVGIGGDPVALLRRARELLTPGGVVLCELTGPGTPTRRLEARIESVAGELSSSFRWADVGVDDVGTVGREAGLFAREHWQRDDRWFAALCPG